MGLHLNFEFRLDGNVSSDEVAERLSQLQVHAGRLPLAYVSEVASAHAPARSGDDALWNTIAGMADVIASVDADLEPLSPRGIPETVIGFVVHPGRGSETAFFCLMRRRSCEGQPVDWHWRCHCKTQYASVVSDEHLVTCHTGLVSILDRAVELGFVVEVRDETRFWETRETSVLLAEVHTMNRIVAAIVGQLHDAIGGDHSLEAPIFQHPNFEHIEMGDEG